MRPDDMRGNSVLWDDLDRANNDLAKAKEQIEKLIAALDMALHPTTPSDYILAEKALEQAQAEFE